LSRDSACELSEYFSTDAFILSDEVKITSEAYRLSLFFGEDGEQNLLYEAELIINLLFNE
jgi:hypothetical protein|tara:strand:+ start:13521 stop:13700 length:180 start_codon:yes stop_codon:yes gene_type:complete